MVQLEPAFEPHILEEEARGLWKARRLPPPGGMLGSRGGPVVLQFEGSFTLGEPVGLIAQRAVTADVDARYFALAGRRALGTLRCEIADAVPALGDILERLGVWTGGDGTVPWDRANRHARVEALVGSLAHQGVVVSRDLPLRACPTCGEPRSPERIIYQEEEGDTHIVRFDLAHGEQRLHALVWVDAPWRLLGTSALLVHPELPYVVAKYRRKDSEELVLTSRSSIERFRTWLPGTTFEVLEEHPGRYFEGRPYDYPLRHEFPTGGALTAPGGTILAVSDVTDTGTGIVALVPGHGSTDAAIAERRGVSGWPLVTPRGQLDLTLMHKYAGLDLRTGSEFIVRDLTESDAIFAHLRVRRGVPHCAVCGSSLVWIPGRAWCLEPARLPPERLELYTRLLPDAPPLHRVEVAPWPISGTVRSDHPDAVALLECSRCERLEALAGPVACHCGGRRYPVRRRLIPSAAGALGAWARLDPFPSTDSIHLYVGERRRVPMVVHHLMAMAGLEGGVGEVGITIVPSVSDVRVAELIATTGADAVRAAFVRAASAGGAAGDFAEHCRVERDRLARLWGTVRDVVALCDAGMLSSFLQPVGGFLGELEPEDRAILARWERARVLALAEYDHWNARAVHRRVFRFLETDLADYGDWVRPRLSQTGTPTTKRAALRTLAHVLRHVAILLGPITPHTSEAICRKFATERTSLFEGSLAPVDQTLLNDELFAAWNRWRSVVCAVAEFRRECGASPDAVVPSAALLVAQDDLGDKLRSERLVLERLAKVGRIEVGSPREPWQGRHRQIRPVEREIQRVYPSQATQVTHLLSRYPSRKAQESGPAGEFSLVIQGQSLRIFPSMVEYVETLPSGVVPCPWTFGEMYLELPRTAKQPARVPPPLSSDAFWLVRRLDRELHRSPRPPEAPPRIAVVAASEPLASELRSQADALARYLDLAEVRVPETVATTAPAPRLTGRTHTGAPWWVQVPGLHAPPVRSKHRPARPKNRRVPAGPPPSGTPEVDYAADEVVGRWQAIRDLGTELDGLMGAPLLGPTKLARAWEQGLTSVEAYRHASFDSLIAVPGVDWTIASLLLQKLGGPAPPSRPRVSRAALSSAWPPNGGRPPPTQPIAARTAPSGPAVSIRPSEPSVVLAPEPRGPDGTHPEPSGRREPPRSNATHRGSGTPRAEVTEVTAVPTSPAPPLDEPPVPEEPMAEPHPEESPLSAEPEPIPEPTLPEPRSPATPEPALAQVGEEGSAAVGPPLPADAAVPQEPPAAPSEGPLPSDVPVPVAATEAEVAGQRGPGPAPEELTTAEQAPGGTTSEGIASTPFESEEGPPAAPDVEVAEPAALEEPAPPPSSVPELQSESEPSLPSAPPAGVELEVGPSLLSSIQPFLDATAAGHRGICLVRESPERVSAQIGSRPVDVYWLTNLGRGKTLKPNDLPGIFAFLSRAVGEDHVTVFFLEGVEYLIRIHGVEALIDRLTEFDRQAKAQDARVWVHLTSDLLRPDDLERLQGSFGSGADRS